MSVEPLSISRKFLGLSPWYHNGGRCKMRYADSRLRKKRVELKRPNPASRRSSQPHQQPAA